MGNGSLPILHIGTNNSYLCNEYLETDWCFLATVPVMNEDTDNVLQSDEATGPAIPGPDPSTSVAAVQENVTFEDAHAPAVDVIAPLVDVSYREDSDEAADLATYLQRPVIIDTFTWNESDTFSTSPRTLYPWKLFFQNTFIARKLANYSRINCTLKLTFRFNASPFYYGLMKAAYDPMSSGKFDPVSGTDLVPISQMPGVYIEPQKDSSIELELPFLWPFNWLDTTITKEFEHIGKLFFAIYAPLKSANGVTTGGITITTYAHAENVVISGPTTQNILQSGIVSGPATAVANAAGFFSKIPRIGPFAKAIQVGSTAVANIAKIFGYSNPPVVADVQPMRNTAFHALANVEQSCPNDVLAVDPLNQVTVDNRVTGCSGEDELAIPNLVTRESYIFGATWDGAKNAGDVLMSSAVTPTLKIESSGTGQTYIYHTPAGFVGRMFRFWHGTMVYKIKLVKSPFHRGRLMINWDPSGTCAPAGAETTVFTKIIDLSTTDDEFEFEVPYKSAQPWLRCEPHANSFVLGGLPDYYRWDYNGTLTVSVLNVLTGPTTLPSISVLMYAFARPDLQFSAPRALPQSFSMNAVQSAISTGPIDGSTMSYADHLPEITVGERVGSLRTILHRATHSITQSAGLCLTTASVLTPGTYRTVNFYDRLPPQYGYDPFGFNKAKGIVDTATTYTVNYCKVHPLNYVLHAFVGYRGSVVVHVNPTCAGGGPEGLSSLAINRVDHSSFINSGNFVTNASYWVLNASAGSATISKQASDPGMSFPIVSSGAGGMTLSNGRTQSGLNAVIPQYNMTRFFSVSPRDVLPDGSTRDTGMVQDDGFRVDTSFVKKDALNNDFPVIDVYWRAGVDFNAVFFTGVPRMYYYQLPNPIVS